MIKIPEGTTQEEVIQIIQWAAKKVCTKISIPNYEVEDIQQEAYIWCIEALEKYNGSNLKTFLYTHIKNRVLNLLRKIDRESMSTKPRNAMLKQQKRSLERPDNIEEYYDSISYTDDKDKYNLEELIEQLDNIELRNIYLKYISGVKLSPCKIKRLIQAIQELVNGKREH